MTQEIVVRVVLASALGAAVGFEREANAQAAGLRTHLSVALGAALFGVISTLGFAEFETERARSNVNVDVARVASNVVVGIGFLGAGVIFRQGAKVRNLTTAASLWVTAAIGLAAGIGNPVAASVTTGMLLAGLVLLRPVRTMLCRRVVRHRCRLEVELHPGVPVEPTLELLHAAGADVEVTDVVLGRQEDRAVIQATLVARPGHGCAEVSNVLAVTPEVWRATTSSLD